MKKQGIDFRLGLVVVRISPTEKKVLFDNGEEMIYDKLAICTGAEVCKLKMPGADASNVYYLRNLEDSLAIKQALATTQKAVVVGAGYIGLEVAASLTQQGIETLVLEAASRVMSRVTCEAVSEFFYQQHQQRGSLILCNTRLTALEGTAAVTAVVGSNGERYDTDMVIVGIGILPRTELAEAAGLEVNNGIVVNEFAQTSDPDIVAAGDCTWHPSVHYGYHTRLECISNATDQARTAAATICGKEKAYTNPPWFWSDQFDLKFQTAGLFQGYDECVLRTEPGEKANLVAWYLQSGKLIAADCINNPRAFMIARQTIAKGLPVEAASLADPSFNLKAILKPSA